MSGAVAVIEPQGYTLSGLAREALRLNNGAADAAVDYLADRLAGDEGLLRSIVRDAVRDAVVYQVHHHVRHDRETIVRIARREERFSNEGNTQKITRGAVEALASGLGRALLDFRLAGGVALRDATREQVMAQADRYGSVATDASHKEKWLRAIGQSVPDGKLVGDVISDERATELFREATA